MRRYITLLVLTFAVSGTACSTPASTSTPTASPARAIEISGNDTMKFSVTEITAKPREKLSVTLVNNGTTPKFSMGHNWVLLASTVDIQQFLIAAVESVTTDDVPGGRTDRDRTAPFSQPRSFSVPTSATL